MLKCYTNLAPVPDPRTLQSHRAPYVTIPAFAAYVTVDRRTVMKWIAPGLLLEHLALVVRRHEAQLIVLGLADLVNRTDVGVIEGRGRYCQVELPLPVFARGRSNTRTMTNAMRATMKKTRRTPARPCSELITVRYTSSTQRFVVRETISAFSTGAS